VGWCPDCGEWDSLEQNISADRPRSPRPNRPSSPQVLDEIRVRTERRRSTGIDELDRVLGGGLVDGQVVLLGGEPGIGKSTLLMQALGKASSEGKRCLYVSGEESPGQIKIRADRLGVNGKELFILAETSLEAVLRSMEDLAPEITVVDSIQMMGYSGVPGIPGSVSQVRECGALLATQAKESGTIAFLVGHVTKDGTLAGPRTLEHIVDTVLYFEGDRFQSVRLVRAVKNRFGPTLELGVFEMTGEGLAGVADPSSLFLGSLEAGVPGGVVVPCMEGRRPLLVEIQSLVAPTQFGTPVRRVTGPDPNRLPMVLAVLEKRGGLRIGGQDVFVNAVGGIRVVEPAVDLGIALAVASSFLDRPVESGTLVAGELGLRGEIRPVSRLDARIAEGGKLGFRRAILPADASAGKAGLPGALEIEWVSTIHDALDCLGS